MKKDQRNLRTRTESQRIEVRDSTLTERAIDELVTAINSPIDSCIYAIDGEYNSWDWRAVKEWIRRVQQASQDAAYQEALSRIGAKAVRRG